ncbi:hypothetical protein MLD38_021832 [Melastoma candidum]|uniref:Uncharacterized protein n=1 Tax=Melastoma candidum TaxID=119954 RepID=A0ACB9QHE0_9MYRT|nr:hypothetical protein MLD38_021832 [Melastoma candidum]
MWVTRTGARVTSCEISGCCGTAVGWRNESSPSSRSHAYSKSGLRIILKDRQGACEVSEGRRQDALYYFGEVIMKDDLVSSSVFHFWGCLV